MVDDGSTDGTADLLAAVDDPRVVVHTHEVNRGKGAAIATAARIATGTHLTICDADLEYDPDDIPKLLRPVIDGEAEVVYGTRTFSSHTSFSFWFVLGNRAVTTFANVLFNCYIRDLETCFKLMPLELYRRLAPLRGLRHGGRGDRQAAPGPATGPTRCRSPTPPAAVPRARSSPGTTGSRRCGSCSASGPAPTAPGAALTGPRPELRAGRIG